MTRKIEKEFWLSKGSFQQITNPEKYKVYPIQFHNCFDCELGTTHKITISWDAPEKKIEISESEFDEIADRVIVGSMGRSAIQLIKKDMFGGEA